MDNFKGENYAYNIPLDGYWGFTYTPCHTIAGEKIQVPKAGDFTVKMPVPGYWDDNVNRMQSARFWETAKFNPGYRRIDYPIGDSMPPDASLPYLVGVGWYRKTIYIPTEWVEKKITLYVGGVVLEAWVWLNGELIKYHLGHSTPFEVSLEEGLRYGEENEIIIAAANTRTDRLGCVIRGFKGFSAGIYRTVGLKVSGKAIIKDCYIYPGTNSTHPGAGDIYRMPGNQELNWRVELDGIDRILESKETAILNWRIKDPQNCSIIAEGSLPAVQNLLEWKTGTFGMKPWSDKTPKLYNIELELELELSNDGISHNDISCNDISCNDISHDKDISHDVTNHDNKVIDVHVQTFGLRLLERDGTALRLNGRPVFLRGATEHAYFPLTCTPPGDVETYKSNIEKLKKIGFNWLRFHTWVPSEEYMEAADRLGMMIQVEPPLGFEKQEWLDILHTCRKHPSVVIYCCGNEELLDEKKIAELEEMASLCRKIAPDALFNPQEAMRGIEYYLNQSGVEEKNVEEPFPHNPGRLEQVRKFSDVFGQYPLGLLSYNSARGDWRILDERLAIYQRPCLSHEICIHGSYMNLDLEHRYEGTRIGTDMFSSLRRNLKKEGLLSRAGLYYENSCAWMRILRKHSVETARKCKYIAGYDLLGAIDYLWHRSGYPCGVMNEFYELKPGESIGDVLKYNGESVILLDCSNNRNLKPGDTLALDLYSSLFGNGPLAEGHVDWYLADDKHHIYQRGGVKVENICNGKIEKLMVISFTAPEIDMPSRITLYARLTGGEYEIANQWDFWVFPEFTPIPSDTCINPDPLILEKYKSTFSKVPLTNNDSMGNMSSMSSKDSMSNMNNMNSIRIAAELNKDIADFLSKGGSAILLGTKPFPVLPTTFQILIAGRVQGNLATVIEDHPLMNRFPHDGFCDWQFYNMIEKGNAVLFNGLNIPFKPIIEVVSSFKMIRRQANLFEMGVGKGRLLVCTLNLNESDAAAMYLLGAMINYVNSNEFRPDIAVSPGELMRLIDKNPDVKYNLATDQALDLQVLNKKI